VLSEWRGENRSIDGATGISRSHSLDRPRSPVPSSIPARTPQIHARSFIRSLCRSVKKYIRENSSSAQNFVVITSGANMDFNQLRFISDRAESSEKLVSLQIPEQPGAFKQLYYDLAYCNVKNTPRSISEFSYRFSDDEVAFIILSFGVTGPEDADTVLKLLKIKGYHVSDLGENEMAKLHGRYLGGGRASLDNEVLYRFEFPERPGALEDFLNLLSDEERTVPYNVTMFHYRNRGSLENSVLVGMQISQDDKADLELFLSQLGFVFFEETNNVMYQEFLNRPGNGKKAEMPDLRRMRTR